MTTPLPPTPAPPRLPRLAARWLPSLMLLTLLGGLLGVYRLGLSLGEPFPGFILLWRKEYKLFTVSWVTPPNWSGPAAGMRINDRILCIDDYMPSPESVVYGLDPRYAEHPCKNGGKNYGEIFRAAYQSADPTVDFFIDRAGELKLIPNVPLGLFSLGWLLETLAPDFLLGLVLLDLGWVVYRANPQIEINLIFTMLMLVASNFAFNNTLAGQITSSQFETGKIALVQIVPWLAFFSVLAFHLTDLLTSPGPFHPAAQFLRRPFYLLSLVVSSMGIVAFTFNDSPINIPFTWVYVHWILLSGGFTGVWSILSLGFAYRRASHRRARMQAGLVLAALAITLLAGIPFMGLFFANQLTFPYMQGLPYLGVVVVGIIAYAILRYQLFAARTQTLTFLLVLVASILAALIVYLPVGSEIGFVPLLGAALLAGSLFAGRVKPLNFLNRLLHREELDYQVATRFSQHIGQSHPARNLVEAAAGSLKDELDAEQVDVWLLRPDQSTVEHYLQGRIAETTPLDPALATQIGQTTEPVYVQSQSGDTVFRSLLDSSKLSPIGVWAPLANRDQALGLLYIGPRWTGEVYGEDDLRLVRLLAAQLSLALANSRQVERAQDMQRLILHAEENERYKIARELHDTVLQFLLVLTFGLESIKENPIRVSERIEDWQGRIGAEANRLRDLLNYLRTPETLEQRGLRTSLDALFEDMRSQTTTRLEWELSPEVELALTVEAKVALYRVMREAVHNALKHARAQQISIRLAFITERVVFSIQDDGRGFDTCAALKTNEKGYNSLQDVRIYVESTGGQLDIQSTPGKGTLIQGWTPALPVGGAGRLIG